MADQAQKKRLARARLEALRNHPPKDWDEMEVAQFHDVVTALEGVYEVDFSAFRISRDRMNPRRFGGQRAPRSGRYTTRPQYSAKLYCQASFVQRQIGGLHLYLQDLDSDPPEQPGNQAPGASATIEAMKQHNELAASEAYRQELVIPGPHDLELRISPSGDVYVYKIWNGGLRSLGQLRLEMVSVQSFDARRLAWREPIVFKVQWPTIRTLPAGDETNSSIFIRFEGDHLGFGDLTGSHLLRWPIGDQSTVRRWLLSMSVVGLSKEWPIELDLRWTVGTKTIELMQDNDISANGSESREQSVATEEIVLRKEGIVRLVPGQEYPKYMRHTSLAPVIVNSAEEQTELGPEWTEVNTSHYPAWRRHWTEKEVQVKSPAEDMALGGGWAGVKTAFEPYRGPRPPRTDLQDPVKWVNDWSISELSSIDRNRIKAKLLRADSVFWKSPDAGSAYVEAMKSAFDGIAKVLFEAGILTDRLLHNEIPNLVWDSAIAGGWYRLASETPDRIFPERLGHYYVWRDETKDWKQLFRSETADWLAALIEGPGATPEPQTPKSSRKPEGDARFQNPAGATSPIPAQEITKSLSKRDQDVHDAVGASNFESLTNTEIMRDRNLGRKLKRDLKLKLGADATKACFDRIRRSKGYPLSRTITNKRSAEK